MADRSKAQEVTGAKERLLDRISSFKEENKSIMEALRLFGISNAEYERAMRALTFSPTLTSASTQPAVREGADALLE